MKRFHKMMRISQPRKCQASGEANVKWASYFSAAKARGQNVILKGRYRNTLFERSFLIYNIFSLGKVCCLKLCAVRSIINHGQVSERVSDVWEQFARPLSLDSKNSGVLLENCNISSRKRRWSGDELALRIKGILPFDDAAIHFLQNNKIFVLS